LTKISTGCKCIDNKLDGGISSDSISLIYGEPETGKTTFAIQCAISCGLKNLKTFFVDCDNTFSTKRLSQLSGEHFQPKGFHSSQEKNSIRLLNKLF